MKLLVTGASGFLGGCAAELAARRGHAVRALVRRLGAIAFSPDLKIEIALGDLSDSASLARAASGVEAVIHCAAATSAHASNLAESRRVNVEGTKALLAAFPAGAPPRWIQISSISAHSGSTSAYGISKREADEAVRASAAIWTILKPSLIYGPQDRGLVAKILKWIARLPAIPVIGDGKGLLRPIYVEDVALAALACIEEERTAGRSYELGGKDEITLDEFFRGLAAAHGLRRPLVHLPAAPMLAAARAMGAVMKNPPVTADNILGVMQAPRVDNSQAERDFGFGPRGFAEGLAAAVSPQKR